MNRLKIVLIGPTYPFKGGIAHYSTLLFSNLKKRANAKFYSFSRPYPKLFFPGSNTIDGSKEIIGADEVKYSIDWANPFTWFKTGFEIRKEQPDMVIFSWWMWGWAIPYLVIRFMTMGRPEVIFICHNVFEHESCWWKTLLTKTALAGADKYIVHSKIDENNLKKIFWNAAIERNLMPSFEIFAKGKDSISKIKARNLLDIKPHHQKILLFFGYVRSYKGLRLLLKNLPKIIKEIPDCALVVAGEFWEEKDQYLKLIKKLGIEKSVYIYDRYIPNEEVRIFFKACDLVVLPYLSATGSAITQLAFGFQKPVLSTNVGDFPEAVEDGRRGIVIEKKKFYLITKKLKQAFEKDELKTYCLNIKKDSYLFSWQGLVSKIID